ncbi:hypothetical protein AMAG_10299 [Allomyces macrogynus ATCC 38327]|uniref:HTH cro/C1-type domain-containing protein n=1 Tax=Allomyces macrogynus (strain ATCC 38327) TaxID=578462 RepID=A0A0L0SU18_ALLM3|nr:hypothetical protein AMAG_10299 [Allomyces macrogynus ATCC 38327]|eukprot:KNE66022.1 hypothetical protein AMAG_10299 [Allomyces macrogynus ATCC 38327]
MNSFTPESNIGWDDQIVVRARTQVRLDTSSSAVNSAMRRSSGALVVEKKATANRAHTGDHRHAAKVDRETETFHTKTVSLDAARAIMQARQAKGWTQKELATKVNEKSTVITDYEQGKAIPNQQVLSRLERALGVKLRGKDIGQPLAPRGKAATAAAADKK